MVWLVVAVYLLVAGVVYGFIRHQAGDFPDDFIFALAAFSWPVLVVLLVLALLVTVVGKVVLLPGRELWEYGYRLYGRMQRRAA